MWALGSKTWNGPGGRQTSRSTQPTKESKAPKGSGDTAASRTAKLNQDASEILAAKLAKTLDAQTLAALQREEELLGHKDTDFTGADFNFNPSAPRSGGAGVGLGRKPTKLQEMLEEEARMKAAAVLAKEKAKGEEDAMQPRNMLKKLIELEDELQKAWMIVEDLSLENDHLKQMIDVLQQTAAKGDPARLQNNFNRFGSTSASGSPPQAFDSPPQRDQNFPQHQGEEIFRQSVFSTPRKQEQRFHDPPAAMGGFPMRGTRDMDGGLEGHAGGRV